MKTNNMSTKKLSLFQQHLNPCFAETGSCEGDGIRTALQAGFNNVISIELLLSSYNYCFSLFKDDVRVKLYTGDSAFILWDIIKGIDCCITFWLDGHSSGGSPKGHVSSPLIYELEQIKKHPIKNHTILIDDLRSWSRGNPEIGFDISDLKDKILEINPFYEFSLADGYFEKDILVATLIKQGPVK